MHALRDVLDKFFNPHSFRLAVPDVWAGFQVNLKMMVIAEVLVLVLGLGLPGLQLSFISSFSPVTYGIISLTLVYTAYVTEVYRAGIESVHPSQRAAARSLALSYAQAMRYVVIPQAVRRVVPP